MAKPRKSKGGRKIRSADQVAAETARAIGMPEAQIARGGFAVENVVDLDAQRAIQKTVRIHVQNESDRWFLKGGSGFDEPQKRAVAWVMDLWRRAGTTCIVARYGESIRGGAADEGASQSSAIAELAVMKGRFVPSHWDAFENICRWNACPGAEGSAAYVFHYRAVGFIASKIAEWRGFSVEPDAA